MATMEERDDRGRKTAKRDDDGREKDKAQLLSLQQWERERHTGPLLSIKKRGGGGENFIVTALPRPNQLTFRELVMLLITEIFSTEFVRLFAICDELLNVHMPHARQ